jgi:deoxyribodipyrimidine photo-lyase
MTTKKNCGIYIFRKDLRIEDNIGLIKLSEKCKNIIPIFIFDPYQTDLNSKTKNYLSFPVLRFICESVKDLNEHLVKQKSRLNVFYGNPNKVLEYIIKIINKTNKYEVTFIGFNEDYTEYSLYRDNKIKELSKKYNIDCISNSDDNTLCSMDLLLKESNIPYKVG